MMGTALHAALEELGVDRDNIRMLGLLPLVYVAWADGTIQQSERSLIHKLAKMYGWLGEDGDVLLSEWLEEPPSDAYVQRGLEVLRSLAVEQRGGDALERDSLRSLVAYCRDVAAAAGCLFGLSDPITEDEEAALTQIADALGVDDVASWRQITGATEARDPGAPPGPSGHVLVGSLLDFNAAPLEFLQDAVNTYGDVVHFSIANQSVFLLRRPEHIQHVLEERVAIYQQSFEREALEKLLGPSTLAADSHRGRALRSSQALFHIDRVATFAEVIVAATDVMLERWSAALAPELDVAAEMARLTLAILGRMLFRADLSADGSELGAAVTVVLEHASLALSNPLRLPDADATPRSRRFRAAMESFDALCADMIAERREREPEGDLLGTFMTREEGATDEATVGELERELLTFLIASHETAANALTWTFFALSKHAAAARRAYREVTDKLGRNKPRHDDTERLPYLSLFVSEAMRLYPPVWAVGRTAVADDELLGLRVPKGATVMLSPWVTHRDPTLFTNPEGFDPERFAERATLKRHQRAYFPFGAGPDSAVGRELARLLLALVVPRVLQRFRLDLVPGFEPGLAPRRTLGPRHGMRMTLRRL